VEEKGFIRVALAGHPNSGKTSVFNRLTGSKQHTGNWPGVTVEKKEGYFSYMGYKVIVTDLPGIYGLSSAYSIDERIAKTFLTEENPDVIVVVVDSTNLDRNLYLPIQLLEMGFNLVLDLNMIDEARKFLKINSTELSRILGIPVVETAANTGEGIEDLKKKIIEAFEKRRGDKGLKIDYGRLEDEIERLWNLVGREYPRWVVIRALEEDQDVLNMIKGLENGAEIIEEIKASRDRITRKFGFDPETIIVERRFGYIKGLVRRVTERKGTEDRLALSDKIDSIVTNRILGIPIFTLVMFFTFEIVFKLGGPISELIDEAFITLSGRIPGEGPIHSLLAEGVIPGLRAVLVFLPNIALLFLVITILEDSGYMARAAFVMDKIMHTMGLHGKSSIPMILGFGCNVPAIMATRTLESEKDRILTIMVIPLMSCSARLPIYVLFSSVFFPGREGVVLFSLYMLGIVLAVVVAKLLDTLFFKGEVAPLVMELPPYRMPNLRGVLIQTWIRTELFLRKAGMIIFSVSVLVWILGNIPFGVEYASEDSLIGKIGKSISPLLEPAGFGFWQAAVSLLFGILAKEVVVGTLGTLYGREGLREAISREFTPLSAYSFMIMSLIYIPCVATVAVIRRETNSWRWTALAISYSLLLGWILSVLVYQVGSFFNEPIN